MQDIYLAIEKLQPLYFKLLEHNKFDLDNNLDIEKLILEVGNRIDNVTEVDIQSSLDFLLRPLLVLLQVIRDPSINIPIRDRLSEALICTLSKVLSRVIYVNNEKFLSIFRVMLKVLDADKNGFDRNTLISSANGMESVFSEEERLGIAVCFEKLFAKYYPSLKELLSVRNDLLDVLGSEKLFLIHKVPSTSSLIEESNEKNLLEDLEMIPPLGFIIYRLLEWAVHDKNKVSQHNSLLAIETLVKKLNNFVIEKFAPGILACTTRVLEGDYKSGQNVFVKGFDLLNITISKLLADKNRYLAKEEIYTSEDAKKQILNMKNARSSKFASQGDKLKDESKKNESQYSEGSNCTKGPVLGRQEESLPVDINDGTEKVNMEKMQNSDNSLNFQLNFDTNESEDVRRTKFNKAVYHVQMIIHRLFSPSLVHEDSKYSLLNSNSHLLSHPSIRLSMARAAAEICNNCRRTLFQSIPNLLDILLLLSVDDYPMVSSYAQEKLQEFLENNLRGKSASEWKLQELITSKFRDFVSSLPRKLLLQDSTIRSNLVNLLYANYKWMCPFLPALKSPSLVDKINSALLQIALFDLGDIRVIQKKVHLLESNQNEIFKSSCSSTDPNEVPKYNSTSIKNDSSISENERENIKENHGQSLNTNSENFCPILCQLQSLYRGNIRDKEFLKAIMQFLRQFGFVVPCSLLLDQLAPILSNRIDSHEAPTPSYKQTAIFLLNELILGAAGYTNPNNWTRQKLSKSASKLLSMSLVNLLDTYRSLILYGYESSSNKDLDNSVNLVGKTEISSRGNHFTNIPNGDSSIESSNQFVLTMCLSLEGIGNIAMMYKSQFLSSIGKNLYPILQRLGDKNDCIRLASWFTLQRMSIYMGYGKTLNINDDKNNNNNISSNDTALISMIKSNIHHIVNSLVNSIRYLKDYDSSLHVLNGLLLHVGELMVPLMGDLLDDIFRGLDQQDEKYSLRFLEILHKIVSLVEKSEISSGDFKEKEVDINSQLNDDNANPCSSNSKNNENNSPQVTGSANLLLSEIEIQNCSLNNWVSSSEYRDKPTTETRRKKLSNGFQKQSPSNPRKSYTLCSFLQSRIQRKISQSKWIDELENNERSSSTFPRETAEQYFRRHHEEKDLNRQQGLDQLSERIDDDDDDDDNVYNDGNSKPKLGNQDLKKTTHSQGFDFVVSIMKEVQHWTSVPSPNVRILVLDIILKGFSVLQQDKKVLLPTIHLLWNALKFQFFDSDYRVMTKALEVFECLSKISRGFLTKRFIDDLWNFLKQQINFYNIFLPKNIASSSNLISQYTQTGDTSYFNFSPSSTSQQGYLACILETLKHVKLPPMIIKSIADTCWFYLASFQPQKLQDSVLEIYKTLIRLDPDQVFLLILELSQLEISSVCIKKSKYDSIEFLNFFECVNEDDTIELLGWKPDQKIIPRKLLVSKELTENFYQQFESNAKKLLCHYECIKIV